MYLTENLKSWKCLERAKKNMPLGVADSYRYWGEKNTVFVESMKGGKFIDVNGKEFIDFRLCYGPIILGYRDQRVDDAVISCIQNQGTMCGFSTELESTVVEQIKFLCPQIEKMRFANSGTEAVLGAVRTARGFTQREKIVVVEGGFHGLYDEMMWKSDVDNWNCDEEDSPEIISFGSGLSSLSRKLVEVVPLNCEMSLREVFSKNPGEIAAIIIEPVMGNCGSIEATQGYMKFLKEKCKEDGTLLIVDEVKTGFRVGKGGVQEIYGVYADLTTYAKALGNGYPIAAFGGRADVMDGISFEKNGVVHGGTYTANLVGLSAAHKTLEILSKTDALKKISSCGSQIKSVIKDAFESFSIPCLFSGPNSMFGVHLSESIPQNYRDWKKTNSKLYVQFANHLISEGIMVEPDSREPWFICEAHTSIDLDYLKMKIIRALNATFKES